MTHITGQPSVLQDGSRAAVLDWLMAGDPAIRWQCLRDFIGAPPDAVEAERGRVAGEGWGARLLERQDPAGTWAGCLYQPKWTSTFYTMALLRRLGLEPSNQAGARAARILLDQGVRRDGGLNYGSHKPAGGPSETCINGMGLAITAYFRVRDERLEALAALLLRQQMADGGWNCRAPYGATHASFHTTISVLEGLLEWERLSGASPAVTAARRRGEEFLLVHRLFRSHTSGAIVSPVLLRLSFPPRWHYDVLRALDYFRDSGAVRDERLAEGIAVLRAKRGRDGRWPLQQRHAGATYFELEPPREPSRWNTLRAMRALDWWEGGRA